MNIKDIELGAVLYIRERLTISRVGESSVSCCGTIQKIVDKLGIAVEGPWHFVSHGLPQDIETEFEVDFCLPVSGVHPESLDYGVQLKELSRFRCASQTFTGSCLICLIKATNL